MESLESNYHCNLLIDQCIDSFLAFSLTDFPRPQPPLSHVLSSPFLRCVMTADHILRGLCPDSSDPNDDHDDGHDNRDHSSHRASAPDSIGVEQGLCEILEEGWFNIWDSQRGSKGEAEKMEWNPISSDVMSSSTLHFHRLQRSDVFWADVSSNQTEPNIGADDVNQKKKADNPMSAPLISLFLCSRPPRSYPFFPFPSPGYDRPQVARQLAHCR